MPFAAAPLAAMLLAWAAPQAEQDVLAFADAFDRAQLAKDVAALEEMVADTLVFVDSSGKRQDKQAFIAGWSAPGDRFDPVVLTDRVVVPLGPDAAVVSAEATLSGTSGGKRFSSRFRFADTFVRSGGKWRVTYIQVTPIR
ncbi:nuclear transport factor 2 family protein [Sphingomonas sp. DT-207]|uniref:nuclear transport factor 2 family protein n=1 Tax=Sphingomonas sp. DT-207 TaxID=3396167 RepID=UPI003F1E02EB